MTKPQQSYRILVVEDNEAIRDSLIDILQAEGHDVISAENGLIGVQLARQHLPNLIISDLIMPEYSGHDMLTELNIDETTASIPFIFLSAKDNPSTIRRSMNMGADDYLVKPVNRQDLLAAIAARMGKRAIVKKQSS